MRSEIAKTTRNHKMQMTGRFHMEIQICGKNPRDEDGVTLTAIFPASWNFYFSKVFIYYSALFLQHTVLNCKNKMTWNLLKYNRQELWKIKENKCVWRGHNEGVDTRGTRRSRALGWLTSRVLCIALDHFHRLSLQLQRLVLVFHSPSSKRDPGNKFTTETWRIQTLFKIKYNSSNWIWRENTNNNFWS